MARYILLPKKETTQYTSCGFTQVEYRFYHQCIIKNEIIQVFFSVATLIERYKNSIVLIVLKWKFQISNRIRKAITNFLFVGLSVTRPVGSHAKCNGFFVKTKLPEIISYLFPLLCLRREEVSKRERNSWQ